MSEPTEWCWDPLPKITGWFAVIRCWEPEEGMFPGAVWVENGVPDPDNDGGMTFDGAGHAGPFPTQHAAESWGYDHDPEGPL